MTLYYDRIKKKQTGIFRNADETIISTDDCVKAFWEPRASNEDLAFDTNGFPYVKTYAMQADGTRYIHYLDTPDENGVYQPDNVKINADISISTYNEWKTARNDAVDNIEVTYNNVVYQGDEKSQDRMARAIIALHDNTTTIDWVAKDNSITPLTKIDLQSILVQAGSIQSQLWNAGRPN